MIEIQLMKAKLRFIYLLVGLAAIFSSCRTSAPRLDYQALARASILLGVDVNLEDNHKLYLEAADWIGVPYRGGGDSKRGTDCSSAIIFASEAPLLFTAGILFIIGIIFSELLFSTSPCQHNFKNKTSAVILG